MPRWLVSFAGAERRDWILSATLVVITAGLAVGQKDFAKLAITVGPIYLYPLDVALAICLLAQAPTLLELARGRIPRPLWITVLMVYLGLGLLYCLEAIIPYRIIAIKDFAYVYYSLYAVILFLWARQKERQDLLAIILVAGVCLAAALNYLDAIQGVNAEWYRRAAFADVSPYGGGVLGLYSGVVLLIAFDRIINGKTGWSHALWTAILALQWGNIILGQTRSVYLGITVGLMAMLGLSLPRWQMIARGAAVLGVLIVATALPLMAWPASKVATHIRGGYYALVSSAPTVSIVEPKPTAVAVNAGVSITGPSFGGTESSPVSPSSTPVPVVIDRSGTVSFDVTDETGAWRVERWKQGFAMFRASPIFGQGFGRPILTYTHNEPPAPDDFNYGLPHNTYLVSLIRQGIAGTCILGCIFLAWAYMILKSWPNAPPEQRARVALAAGLAVTGLVYGMFSLFFESPFLAVPFWMIVGIGAAIMSLLSDIAPKSIASNVSTD